MCPEAFAAQTCTSIWLSAFDLSHIGVDDIITSRTRVCARIYGTHKETCLNDLLTSALPLPRLWMPGDGCRERSDAVTSEGVRGRTFSSVASSMEDSWACIQPKMWDISITDNSNESAQADIFQWRHILNVWAFTRKGTVLTNMQP